MAKLIWSDQAIDDLVIIGDFIAQDSEKFAKLIVNKLFNRVQILKPFLHWAELFLKKLA